MWQPDRGLKCTLYTRSVLFFFFFGYICLPACLPPVLTWRNLNCDSSYCSVSPRSLCCQDVRILLAGEKPPNLSPWCLQLCLDETKCSMVCVCLWHLSVPVVVPKTYLLLAAVICICPCSCLAWAHNDKRGARRLVRGSKTQLWWILSVCIWFGLIWSDSVTLLMLV